MVNDGHGHVVNAVILIQKKAIKKWTKARKMRWNRERVCVWSQFYAKKLTNRRNFHMTPFVERPIRLLTDQSSVSFAKNKTNSRKKGEFLINRFAYDMELIMCVCVIIHKTGSSRRRTEEKMDQRFIFLFIWIVLLFSSRAHSLFLSFY